MKAPQRNELLWVGIDFDNTLFRGRWTPENPTSDVGEPMWENIAKARELAAAGFKLVIHSARAWGDYEVIEAACARYDIPVKAIVLGKLLVRAYVDDRAINANEASWIPPEWMT